jgi:flagellar basal-body rod protein FlgC
MSFDSALGALNIAASGLGAERLRMEVVANNIANASVTNTPNGGPYRRRDVVFETVLSGVEGDGSPGLGGVRVAGLVDDQSELPRIYNPGHQDADVDGFVTMPNVSLPTEMVNLITASRAYEANLRVAQSFLELSQSALALTRG